ncbi:hypothetical protein CASFOL_031983 [Castilleja foliolosa]|uniref:Uncharacterized protein n=1 Tax=Castilleja foliolosa TaxID=1961234 RepID=A0ABD3C0V7_9LAMI
MLEHFINGDDSFRNSRFKLMPYIYKVVPVLCPHSCHPSFFLWLDFFMDFITYLAVGGQLIASRFELHDVQSQLPVESEYNSTSLSDKPSLPYVMFLKIIGSIGMRPIQTAGELLVTWITAEAGKHPKLRTVIIKTAE